MPKPPSTLNRDILRLAVPALGSLIAEPLFLIVDSALVGHLGVTPLAGLGIASAVLQTIVGLMVFLAYATTPAVARRFGAGDPTRAVSVGIDGMWLALGMGAILALAGYLATPLLVGLFGADAAVARDAETYLGISMWGLPAMLIVFAATGLLRGMQDTVTPLWIAGLGFGANALLNWLFIYGLGRHLGRCAEQRDEHGGGQIPPDGEDGADSEREPQSVDAHRHRLGEVTGAEPSRHGGGGGVCEEDHQPDDRLQHRRSDPEGSELRHAEVTHQRRVDDQEEGLGHQGAQRGNREAQDVAVQRARGRHPSRLRAQPVPERRIGERGEHILDE